MTARGGGGPAARRRAPAHARAAGARGLRRRPARRRRGGRRLPARRGGARSWPSCARAGTRVVDLSADFRLRDRAHLRGLVRRAQGAGALRAGRLRAAGAARARRSRGADLVANPGCYPTAALLGARAAGPGGPDRRRRDRRASPACPAPAARRRTRRTSSRADENVSPYKIEGHRHTPEIEQELGALGSDVTITFTPHLLPLAQGELVSCYVTPSRELDEDELVELFDDAYAREPFVELRDGPGRRDRRARHQLLPHLVVHGPAHGPGDRLRGDRQPVEGRGVAGRAEPEPDVRAARDARAAGDELSLALARDARARDREPRRPARGLPRRGRRVRAEAVAAALDLGLMVCAAPDARQRRALHPLRRARRAGRAHPGALRGWTRSAWSSPTPATPTPRPATAGSRTPRACRARPRWPAASREDQVAVASTGVIGVPLDAERRSITRHRRARAASCASYGDGDFSEAIRTTDKFAKEVEVDVALPSGTVRLTAQAKGAGMISPAFATMLCFVQTDAALERRDRRPAARRVRRALVRPRLRRRPALHQRHRDPAGVAARAACASSRETEDEAALRRGAGLGAAQARAGHRARRRGLQADRPRRRRAAATTPSWRASRARSRTRRWSRPRCTAATRTGAGSRRRSAAALHDTAPLRARHLRSRACRSAPRARRCRYDEAALAEAVAATRSSTTVALPGRRRRGRGLLLRPLARVRDINADYTT